MLAFRALRSFRTISRPLVASPVRIRSLQPPLRPLSAKTSIDERVEAIAQQYSIAKDEFEIATEETEKKSIYAAEDRQTARDELEVLQRMVEETAPEDREAVGKRVAQRVRELKNAVETLNKADEED